MRTSRENTYSAAERNSYFLGMVGENILASVVMSSLAYYFQFTLLIPAIAVGVILTITRVWDTINDPLMGLLVDKTRTRYGKCRPYLFAAPVPIYLFTVLCYLNVFGFFDTTKGLFEGNNARVLIWALGTYIVWTMLFTVGDIPLWGITARMTHSEKDRSRLLSYARIGVLLGGGGTFLLFQPLALGVGQRLSGLYETTGHVTAGAAGERLGFILTAVVFGFGGVLLYQSTGFFVKERVPTSPEKISVKDTLRVLRTNKPFRQIFVSGLLTAPKALLVLSLTPMITYYYANKDPRAFIFYMGLWGGSMFGGQFSAILLVPRLIKKFAKKTVYNTINLCGVLPFLSLFLLFLAAPTKMIQTPYLIFCAVVLFFGGASNGFSVVLQSIMVADAVDYEEYRSGIRPDGTFFSGLTFVSKMGTSIAALISGAAYSLVGFSGERVAEVNAFIAAGGIPRLEPAYAPYMTVLFFLVTIPPAVGGLLAVLPTWRYALSDEEHTKMLASLNERRQRQESVESTETRNK